MKYVLFAIGGYLCGIMLCYMIPDDGTSQEVESDGTMVVDVTQYAYVFAQLPKRP